MPPSRFHAHIRSLSFQELQVVHDDPAEWIRALRKDKLELLDPCTMCCDRDRAGDFCSAAERICGTCNRSRIDDRFR